MPTSPFRPLKACQNVARHLLSFFRKERGATTHHESAILLVSDLDKTAAEDRQILNRTEDKLKYHLLSTMYLENRSTPQVTARLLSRFPSFAPTYFRKNPDKLLEYLIFALPFIVLHGAGASSRSLSGVWFWKQKENTHAFLSVVRSQHDAVEKKGLMHLLEACLESYQKWHQGFYVDMPAVQSAFSIASNPKDDQERIVASLCYGSASDRPSKEEQEAKPGCGAEAEAYWLGKGRALLSGLIADLKLEPERVANALLGLALAARWDKAARPDGGYRAMMRGDVPDDPFHGITLTEIPMPFQSQMAFATCLADDNLRSLIFAAAVRRERAENSKTSELIRASITDHTLFEGVNPDPKIALKARVVEHVTVRSEAIFERLKAALAELPVDMDYVKQQLSGSSYRENMDIFEFLSHETCFEYVAEATARYYRANVASWDQTIERVGSSLSVVSSLFKFQQDRSIPTLTEKRYGRGEAMPPCQLRYDFGKQDLDTIFARLVEKGETSPDHFQASLAQYANVCIVHAVVQRALSKEAREILTVRARDLAFGEPQEEENDDEAVVQ